MRAEHEHRLLVAAERIGTGLLRLAAVEEARRGDDRPRDVFGLWVRPSQVDAVSLAVRKWRGNNRDVAEIQMRSGTTYAVWRAYDDRIGYQQPTETVEELLDRVLRALGWVGA